MRNVLVLTVGRAVIFSLLPLTLAACGSSSSTDPTVPPVTPPPTRASFSELSTLASKLFDEQDPLPVTPVANMPVSGTATYSGAAAYKSSADVDDTLNYPDYQRAILDNPAWVSDVKLTANFASDTVAGKFSNFQSAVSGPLGGEINFDNAGIRRDGSGDYADFEGPVSGIVDSVGVVGSVFGEFVGDSAEYILGRIDADLDGANTLGATSVNGVFTAKQ
jgi:hypothetical protein